MNVRLATPLDADQIAVVLYNCFREFEPLYTPAGFRATTPPGSEIAARFASGDPTWVAVAGQEIVGTVGAVRRTEDVYVRSMGVLPGSRGGGVGTRLLAEVEAFGSRSGASRLTLTTTPFLTAAIAMYERSGFRMSGAQLDLHGTPLLEMVKPLARSQSTGDQSQESAADD